jgi:hypothetical protein
MYGGGGPQQLFGTVMPLSFEIHVLMRILMEAFVCCCLRKEIIWHAALSSSHHAMRCCHDSSFSQMVEK